MNEENSLTVNADGELVDKSSISGALFGISIDRSAELIDIMDDIYYHCVLAIIHSDSHIEILDVYNQHIVPLTLTYNENLFVHMLLGTLVLRLRVLSDNESESDNEHE